MAAGFSADGDRVLTVDYDTVEIWNAEDGKPVKDVEKLKDKAALYKDGKRVFRIGTNSPTIFEDAARLLIWQSDAEQREWRAAPSAKLQSRWWGLPENIAGQRLDISRTATPLIAQSTGDAVVVHEVTTWNQVAELRGHEDKVFGAAFFANGKRMVTASLDGSLRIWNLDPNVDPIIEMGRWQGQPNGSGWFVAGGKRVLRSPSRDEFSRYAGSSVTLWDSASGASVAEAYDSASLTATPRQKALHGDLRDLDVSPDGERLATVHFDSNPCVSSTDEPKPTPDYTPVRIWETRTGKLLGALEGFRRSVATARFSPDGNRLLTFADGNYHYAVFRNGKPFGGGSGGNLWRGRTFGTREPASTFAPSFPRHQAAATSPSGARAATTC